MQQHDNLLKYIEKIKSGNWGASQGSQLLGAVQCVRGADIPDINRGQTDNIPTRYIDKTKLKRYLLSSGDIVIEKSGGSATQSTGRVAIIKPEIAQVKPTVCSNFCAALTFSQSIDPQFIYYYLSFIYKLGIFANYETKTNGIHNLMLDQVLSSIMMPQFDIVEQKLIATCLSTIDNKITENKKDIQLLTDTIHFIYNYWFIQFDFPDENGRPYKSSGGKMAYNEQLKQEIPVGWEAKKLVDLFSFERGTEVGTERYVDHKVDDSYVKFYRVRDVGDDSSTWVSKENDLQIVKPGDVVITLDGTVGKIGIDIDGAISGGLRHAVDNSHKISNSMIWSILNSYYIQESLRRYVSGRGSILAHAGGAINDLSIPYSEHIFKKFQNVTDPMFALMVNCQQESKLLASLRDWLLPMLMNGQIEIKDEQQE